MLCGGASAARPATEETQRIAEQDVVSWRAKMKDALQHLTLFVIAWAYSPGQEEFPNIYKAPQPLKLTFSLYSVKAQIEEKEGKTFDVFTAVEFKIQLVAGTNYFIKVHVGNEEFLHLRVFKSLPHENEQLSLHSYQGSKTKHDELAYF